MKKCKGCGETLQYENKELVGYAPNKDFEYCQRCFRLTHYGDTKKIVHDISDNDLINTNYKKIDKALFVLIVDCFDGLIIKDDKLLKQFLDKDVLLVINKIDLLPRNINDKKIENLYLKELSAYSNYPNLKCIITYKNDYTFNDLFYSLLEESGYKKAVFVGRVNAGKSSLINKLLKNHDLTTSIYPGTTTNFNEIKFSNYTFIDTPGLLDEESYITYLDNDEVKAILPLKTLKAQSFQLYEDQAYFVQGLVEVDIKPKKNCSIIFFINNNLEVHRSKLEKAKQYLIRNKDSFKLKLLPFKDHKYNIKRYQTFYLKGLGIFKINGECVINIKVNDKIKIYNNEVNI